MNELVRQKNILICAFDKMSTIHLRYLAEQVRCCLEATPFNVESL